MRVEAIESFSNGILRTYGEGEMTNEVPNTEPFSSIDLKNPCIKLDSGQYVWGFQCWWGPVDRMKDQYHNKAKEIITVQVEKSEEVLPK